MKEEHRDFLANVDTVEQNSSNCWEIDDVVTEIDPRTPQLINIGPCGDLDINTHEYTKKEAVALAIILLDLASKMED